MPPLYPSPGPFPTHRALDAVGKDELLKAYYETTSNRALPNRVASQETSQENIEFNMLFPFILFHLISCHVHLPGDSGGELYDCTQHWAKEYQVPAVDEERGSSYDSSRLSSYEDLCAFATGGQQDQHGPC